MTSRRTWLANLTALLSFRRTSRALDEPSPSPAKPSGPMLTLLWRDALDDAGFAAAVAAAGAVVAGGALTMRGERYGVQVSRGRYAGARDVHLAPRRFALGQG